MSSFYGHPSVAPAQFVGGSSSPQAVNRLSNATNNSCAMNYDDRATTASRTGSTREALVMPSEQSISPASAAAGPEGSDEHPAWSELKTKAGKDRKRLPLACIACRRKKIRCSGEKPACKHCQKSRIPCVYKVTVRKAAPRTDYMAMLDKRLRRMEERVIKIIPKNQVDKLPAITRAIVKPSVAQNPQKAASARKRSADEAFNTESEPFLADGAPGKPDGRQAVPDDNTLITDGVDCLPSKEIQEHLAEVYFDYVYGQSYFLLHKPSFFRRLHAGKIPPVLILAVCAVSARFSTHPQLSSEPAFLRGESWARPARDIALRRFDSPNITILIVFLLLGLHEFGTCQGGRSWMYGGMAHRMAYALQLHKDLDYDPLLNGRSRDAAKLSPIDREIRRRTMWACFMMDRFNSSGTERPMFANEKNLALQLPIREDLFQLEVGGITEQLDGSIESDRVSGTQADRTVARSNMGVAAYTVRLVALWGRLIQYLNLGGHLKEEVRTWHPNSGYRDLQNQIEGFRSALPDNLKFTKENLLNHATENLANQFLHMHIAFNQIVLFANRFSFPGMALTRVPKDVPFQFVADARKAALEAANMISTLIDEAANYRLVVPFAGYCTYLSSAVHIHGIFSKNAQLESTSKENLARNHRYLARVKKYWGMFHFLGENLKELYRAHADAAARGLPAASGGARGVFQYGDWYDRYPHGVSATDYEEPVTKIKAEAGNDAVLSQKTDLQSVDEFFATLSPRAQAKRGRGSRRAAQKPTASSTSTTHKSSRSSNPPAPTTTTDTRPSRALDHLPALGTASTPFGPPESYDRSQIRPLATPTPAALSTTSQPSPAPMSPATFSREMAQLQAAQQQQLDGAPSPFGGTGSVGTAGTATGTATTDPFGGLTPGMSTNLWDVDLGMFGDDFLGGETLGGAWFAPFNMSLGNFGVDDGMGDGGAGAGGGLQQSGWYPAGVGQVEDAAGLGGGGGGGMGMERMDNG